MKMQFHGHNGAPPPKMFELAGGTVITMSEGLHSAGVVFEGHGNTEEECRADAARRAAIYGWPCVSKIED